MRIYIYICNIFNNLQKHSNPETKKVAKKQTNKEKNKETKKNVSKDTNETIIT